MKHITTATLGICQGSKVMFADFAHGGAMWTGNGPRESRHAIRFDSPFSEAPTVMVGIAMWDMDQTTAVRADIVAEKVTRKGFDLVFRTWADTRVARIRADWTALGPVRTEDDWEVD
ncbi:H-type lectin domain-containing protein [Cereibacter sp. SYSU M97828]|nr:H-type lectin domain-containing protein [Cereibacter flavus]